MTPQQIIFLSIVGIALVALIFLSESQKRYNLDSIKRKTVGDGQYGTARWATQEEIQSSTIQVPYEPEAWRYNKESRPTTAGIVVNLKQNKKQILATIDPSDSHTLMVAGTGGGEGILNISFGANRDYAERISKALMRMGFQVIDGEDSSVY